MITTDTAMRDLGLLPRSLVRDLQDAHNVNLNAAGEGNEALDADCDDEITACMRVVEADDAFSELFDELPTI